MNLITTQLGTTGPDDTELAASVLTNEAYQAVCTPVLKLYNGVRTGYVSTELIARLENDQQASKMQCFTGGGKFNAAFMATVRGVIENIRAAACERAPDAEFAKLLASRAIRDDTAAFYVGWRVVGDLIVRQSLPHDPGDTRPFLDNAALLPTASLQ
jgi:hypothetical protein